MVFIDNNNLLSIQQLYRKRLLFLQDLILEMKVVENPTKENIESFEEIEKEVRNIVDEYLPLLAFLQRT
jgi:hypothetical protein